MTNVSWQKKWPSGLDWGEHDPEARGLNAQHVTCTLCSKSQMRAVIYAELKMLVERGQMSKLEMSEACEDYCLGHVGEWIPDYVIREE